MAKDISSDFLGALQDRSLIERRYIWMTVKHRTTGAFSNFGFGNIPDTQAFQVRDGITGLLATRTFRPGLVSVGTIRMVSDMTIQNLEIELSGVDPRVENAIRGFTPRQAPIQVYIRLYNNTTKAYISPAEPVFVGFIDRTPIQTPEAGGVGSISLVCNSYGYELTRNNPDMRSNSSQKDRSASDRFFKHVQNVPDWKVWWGTKHGKPDHNKRDGKKKND